MENSDPTRPATSAEVASALTEEQKLAAFERLKSMPVDELQSKFAEIGPLAWRAGFLLIGVLIPFTEYTDPAEIKKRGTQFEADLEMGIFTASNFAQMGLGEARLKVALLMHAMESLQSEVIAEANQEGLLKSLKATGREQA
jgi:hypothetical protein